MKITKWETLVKEAKKCVLLCSNCHREVHAGSAVVPELDFEYSFGNYDPTNQIANWDDIDLEKELKNLGSYSAIAKKYNTTTSTVIKWGNRQNIKNNNIGRGKKKIKLSDDDFLVLLEQKGLDFVHKKYKISKVALWKRKKRILYDRQK